VNQQIEIKPGELRCPRCFGKDIVKSLPRGFLDSAMRRLNRVPRHCRACGKRFYISRRMS
jgi:DNA-directed RNA polymerase subunit RPC12/RpoP